MERQVPWVFNDVSIVAPLEPISEELADVGRTKVRVFTKFRNRNGSYIDELTAERLIETAVDTHVPIVGFFDKETDDFTSHVPEDLACAYGYCDKFEGWEKHLDADGVEREYATFGVVLHTNYFAAANRIVGNPQSMELDVNSISGDWVQMDDGKEYFVYKTAKMKGFTVLGKNVEPCFQGAAFFSENENRFDRFSLLLERVREAESKEGGKIDMDEKEVKQVENFEEEKVEVEETGAESEIKADEPAAEIAEEQKADEAVEAPAVDFAAEYEKIKQDFDELQLNFANVETELKEAKDKIEVFEKEKGEYEVARTEFEKTINELNERLKVADEKIAEYEAKMKAVEDVKKQALVDSYAESLSEEEMAPIKENMEGFAYSDLEKELAVVFARKVMSESKKDEDKKAERIPVIEEEQTSFSKMMAKYRK